MDKERKRILKGKKYLRENNKKKEILKRREKNSRENKKNRRIKIKEIKKFVKKRIFEEIKKRENRN